MSQEELAELVGVHRGTVARWEAGECEPQPRHVDALSEVSGRSTRWIRGEVGRWDNEQERRRLYSRLYLAYGYDTQLGKLHEEAGELSLIAQQIRNKGVNEERLTALVKEIVDCEQVIEQAKLTLFNEFHLADRVEETRDRVLTDLEALVTQVEQRRAQ